MDHVPGESIHQEALAITEVATFVGPHAGEPSLERAHATDVVSHDLLGHRDATRARHGPVGGEAGEGEVRVHEQGERRRRRSVAARRRAPGAADGAQPGAVFDAREAADHDPEDIRRDVRPGPTLRFIPCVKSCHIKRHFIEHLACAAADGDGRGLQTGREGSDLKWPPEARVAPGLAALER